MPRNPPKNSKVANKGTSSRSVKSVVHFEVEPSRFQSSMQDALQSTKATFPQSTGFAQTSLDEVGVQIFWKAGKKRKTIKNVWKAQAVKDGDLGLRCAWKDVKGSLIASFFRDDESVLVEPNRFVSEKSSKSAH